MSPVVGVGLGSGLAIPVDVEDTFGEPRTAAATVTLLLTD
jgi:hypothetical protein